MGLTTRHKAAAFGCAALVAALGLGAILVFADSHGGEPYAVVALPPQTPSLAGADTLVTGSIHPPASASTASAETAGGAPSSSVENGVTVFRAARPGGPAHSGPMVIKVPDALGQNEIVPVDARLVEPGRYGPLPRIGSDGSRASEIYARPPVFAGTVRPGAPRIAIYIGGLGLSQSATQAAIDHMPAAVSLAFAPYGDGLEADVGRAKAAGHEVLLQLPMEGFGDATEARAGPHTLMAAAPGNQTLDDLHWLFSRMSGYVGVTGFLGARFTADKTAMTILLREIADRGLLYVDDGTSARSLGPTLAPALSVPATHVDVVLDGDPAALRAALVKLEAVARDKGSAVGMANDLPGLLEPIAAYAAALPAKGIALVPVSALASGGVSAMAATP